MQWEQTNTANPQTHTCRNLWILVGLVVLPTFIAQAQPWEPQGVATMGIKIRQHTDANTPEPNEIPVPKVHPPVTIHGDIFVLGKPIPGVEIQVENLDTSIVTDTQGHYAVEVPYGWSGVITPVKQGWVFDPPMRKYECVRKDIDDRRMPDNPFAASEEEESADPPPISSTISLGRLGITPMVVSRTPQPGQLVKTDLRIQNMGTWSPHVTIAFADLEQDRSGEWMPVEPNASYDPFRPHSCRAWLSMDANSLSALSQPIMGSVTCPLLIHVPTNVTPGFYSAAVLIHPHGNPDKNTVIGYAMVIPVLMHINENQTKTDVHLDQLELIVPFTVNGSDCPRVRLTATNQGNALSRIGASAIATPTKFRPNSTEPNEIQFPETWVLPGATVQLETDYVGPHPDQPLSINGYLKTIKEQHFTKQLLGSGDPAYTEDPEQTIAMLDYDDGHAFLLEQDRGSRDPYHTYVGRCRLGMITNFPAIVRSTASACSIAEGQWVATPSPAEIYQPTDVELSVRGTQVQIEKLPGGARNVPVAKVAIQLIPKIARWRP